MITPSKRVSKIWLMPKEDFKVLVKQSNTTKELLKYFGLSNKGNNYKTVWGRIEEDKIDASHITRGYGHAKGKLGRISQIPTPLVEVLTIGSTYCRGHLKRRLIKENLLINKCSICGITPTWNNKVLILILDHINGVGDDNRIENLRLVCPNCNSQLLTFAGRNKKFEKKEKKVRNCSICGSIIGKQGKTGFCFSCIAKNKRKIKNRPSLEELLEKVNETNWSAVAKELGVSDVAIRKWAKQELEKKGLSFPYKQKKFIVANSLVAK